MQCNYSIICVKNLLLICANIKPLMQSMGLCQSIGNLCTQSSQSPCLAPTFCIYFLFTTRVLAQPESMPALDWAYYSSRVAAPGLVEQFQKQMAALKIPYPEDKVSNQIDAQAKEAVSMGLLLVRTEEGVGGEYGSAVGED